MRLLLVLPFILIGCAPQVQTTDPGAFNSIDPAFVPYYNSFDAMYGTKVATPIAFVAQKYPTVGECMKYSDGHRQIEVDPDYWEYLDPQSRTVLIYHELGHCVFNRLHNWDTFADGCPLSIMQFDDFGDPCYSLHEADYMAELPHAEIGDHL